MKNTVDILLDIVKENNKDISEIFLHEFSYPEDFTNDFTDSISFAQLKKAHVMYNEQHISFWGAIMITSTNNAHYSPKILSKILHRHSKRNLFALQNNQNLSDELKELSNNIFEKNYAINSKIKTNIGEIKHFLFLDFRMPVSSSNTKLAKDIIKNLGISKGYLLNSGRSYHFIGIELYSWNFISEILYKCIFLYPVIDIYWIAHQLMDNSCSLRISAKNGFYPQVIEKI